MERRGEERRGDALHVEPLYQRRGRAAVSEERLYK
jgi:hypothetical protein